MPSQSAKAYLDLPADARFETRMPTLLKRHAETVAHANGESLSQYVMHVLAERVAQDIGRTVEWRLTVPEQIALLRIVSAPAHSAPSLVDADRRAAELFEVDASNPE